MVEGYCVRCKKTVTISGAKESTTANGRKMMKGTCPKCSTTVCRFVKG